MKTIKLDAIDSTNDYLKKLSKKEVVENFTMVLANSQSHGKGQRGASWSSEEGKNVIMSVLLKDLLVSREQLFGLNVLVSVSVFEVLEEKNISKLHIKWPNDIMSDAKKIGGILIENTFKTDNSIVSIVGIGLNVNQTDFSMLPQASSLAITTGASFDIDELAAAIRQKIHDNVPNLATDSDRFWSKYHHNLFKMEVPMAFEDNNKVRFMGMVKGVSPFGKLQLLLEDDSVKEFEIKEVQMLY